MTFFWKWHLATTIWALGVFIATSLVIGLFSGQSQGNHCLNLQAAEIMLLTALVKVLFRLTILLTLSQSSSFESVVLYSDL